jgi:hypothetical protein
MWDDRESKCAWYSKDLLGFSVLSKECESGHTAAARKLVAYLLAVDRRKRNFVPAEEF